MHPPEPLKKIQNFKNFPKTLKNIYNNTCLKNTPN